MFKKYKYILFASFVIFIFIVTNDYNSLIKSVVITVSADGKGQYKTISDACKNAKNGDTIYIYNGVYYENIDIRDKKLSLIGESKENCILISNNDSYDNPPLEISKGYVTNITIYAQRLKNQLLPQKYNPPYGVHIDFDYETKNNLTFSNCKIISDWNAACGIGMRNGFSLLFINCDIRANASNNMGAIFFHDSTNKDLRGKSNLTFNGCNITAHNKVLTVLSLGFDDHVNVLFKNNYFMSDNSKVSIDSYNRQIVKTSKNGNGFLNTNTIFLSKESKGNNLPICNYKK